MKKFYVIDTNVLIQSPDAIKNFEDKSDNRILKVCKGLKEDNKSAYVCLVTKDIVLRIKAQIIGLNAEDYTTEQIRADDEGNAIPLWVFGYILFSELYGLVSLIGII